MARLSRKLRVCKWVGTVGCLLIAMAFVFSLWGVLFVQWISKGSRLGSGGFVGRDVVLVGGIIEFNHEAYSWTSRMPRTCLELYYSKHIDCRFLHENSLPVVHHSRRINSVSTDLQYDRYDVQLPLWLPFLVLLIPTLLLWRRDRKPRRANRTLRLANGRLTETVVPMVP